MSHAPPQPRNPSHWKGRSEPLGLPRLEGKSSADVAVVGAGITGLTTALLLQRAGHSVVVLEAGRVGEGITGYSTAKVTSLHALTYASLEKEKGEDAAGVYAASNEWGLASIERTVAELGIDCGFERHAALTYASQPDGVETIEQEVDAARRAGLPVELVRGADLPFPVAAGVLLPEQACFDPLRYCQGLARALGEGGSRVYEGTRAADVEDGEDVLRVVTRSEAVVEAPHVVLACGLPFVDRGGMFARAHPSRSYCLALDIDGALPDSMSINIESPTRSVRPIPASEGGPLLLIAGEDHKVGQAADTEERYLRLEEFARRHFPVRSVAARWSAQDYIPVDGVPLIGRMPLASDRLLVATGFRKWGITAGTAAARILSDIVQGRDNPWASVYDARRSQLPDGVGEALKENLDVVKRFVGDRLRQRDAPSPEELEPGTGAICRLEGKPVAAYRDDAGELHRCSPVCTHMGCRVTWNAAERSWDCPCHGSRFDVDGEVLFGPAVSPLDPR